MSEELNVIEFDCSTGQSVTRPMNEEEVASFRASQAAATAAKEAQDAANAEADAAKLSARTKLAALGLTEAEVAALVK